MLEGSDGRRDAQHTIDLKGGNPPGIADKGAHKAAKDLTEQIAS